MEPDRRYLSPSEEAERGGYRDDCDRCRYAVAAGREACPIHYVPIRERLPERQTGQDPPGGEA